MQLNNLTRIMSILAVAATSGGSLANAAPAVSACNCASETADWNFHSEASQLLKEIRSSAHRLTDNAENLRAFRPGGVSWQGHANELMLAREQVNAVGERIQRLQAIRHVLLPWQQEAVDSVTLRATDVASRTEAAIRHLNDNRNQLWSETYQDHLKTLASQASLMKHSVGVHIELAETQDKLEALRDKAVSIGS
jgi:hypothetical protein